MRYTVPLVGPTNTLDATYWNADPERTINLFPERVPPGRAKTDMWLRNTPGLRPWMVLGSSPIRCLFQQDGRAFAIAGGSFYEVFSGGGNTSYGSVAIDEFMGCIVSNGTAGDQLLITSGGLGYTFTLSTNTFAAISDPDFPPAAGACEFIDGYGIVFQTATRSFYISALEDFTSWDGLDVAERSIASDNIAAIIRRSRELWLLGTKTSEVWYDSGDSLFPFQPVSNLLIDHGTAGPFNVQRIVNTIGWLDQSTSGQGILVTANGYTPDRISTYSIDQFIRQAGVAADGDFTTAVGWSYQESGHDFYGLMIPDAEATYVADFTMPGIWHERCRGTCGSALIPSVVNSHMYFDGKHLVGDRFSGAIYEQSLAFYDEQIVTP